MRWFGVSDAVGYGLIAAALSVWGVGCDRAEEPESEAASETTEARARGPAPRAEQTEAEQKPSGAAAPRRRRVKTTPERVWAARYGEGRFELELTRLSEEEREELEGRLEGSEDAEVAYRDSTAPSSMEGVSSLDVATTSGPERVDLSSLAAVDEGDGVRYLLRTAETRSLEGENNWTLATPAGEMSSAVRLRPAEPADVSAEVASNLEAAVREKLEGQPRENAGVTIQRRYFSAVEARFPGDRSMFVALNVLAEVDEASYDHQALLATSEGEVTEVLEKEPGLGLGPIEVLAVADIDGDGIDGVLYEREVDGAPVRFELTKGGSREGILYELREIRWLHFDEKGRPSVDTLASSPP